MRFLRPIFIIGLLFISNTASAQSITTAFSDKPFTDVSISHENYEAIEYLRSHNVIKGYLDNTYKPNTPINRAEFVEFIINPLILDTNDRGDCVRVNIPEASKTVFFSDVLKKTWYADNVCFAKVKKIVDGYPDHTFRPADSINFVEGAKIISNVFSMSMAEYQEGEFWYKPYVARLSELHAIPTSVTHLNKQITRGEMAEIVYRLKMDSTQKSYMAYDYARNTLSPRAAVTVVVPAPKPPVVLQYNRPTARSIKADAELQNSLLHRSL